MSAAEIAGGALGGVIGGTLGAPILPPLGGLVGRFAGRYLGQLAARAAMQALAAQMESADEAADAAQDGAAEKVCADCAEVDCFEPPPGADPGEFRRQLKEQQDALRQMQPRDILRNMDSYASVGRPASDARLRAERRARHFSENIEARTQRLIEQGHAPDVAEGMASDQLLGEMADLDATHIVDLIAGGDGTVSGLGQRSANRSIGSQWRHRGPGSDRTRAQQLRAHAEQADREGASMQDLTLTVCGDEDGGVDDDGAAPADGAGSGNGGPGSPGPYVGT